MGNKSKNIGYGHDEHIHASSKIEYNYQLPLRTRISLVTLPNSINSNNQNKLYNNSNFNMPILEFEKFIISNKMVDFDAICHVILDNNDTAIGVSFSSACKDLSSLEHNHFATVAPIEISDQVDMFTNPFFSRIAYNSEDLALRNLKGIKDVLSLQFIDFDFAGFEEGIQEDLAYMHDNGSLIGLSLFNGDHFINIMKNHKFDNITGLVVGLNNVSLLVELNLLFPELKFLCIMINGRESLNQIFEKKYFGLYEKLEALYITSAIKNEGIHSIRRINSNHERININFSLLHSLNRIKWMGINGSMLTWQDQFQYDRYSRLARDHADAKTEHGSMNSTEFVFFGFGFSTGGCRSMKAGEYRSLEQFWRTQ